MRLQTSHFAFIAAPLFAALAACQSLPTETPPAPVKLTILHTNDHHGRFWANKDGEYGMAARKTVIDAIRKEVNEAGGYSLLLSGGDINTGVPESDTLDAEPDFKGMAMLGYDAMAVGNHEFDNSVATIRQQEAWAKFPFLAANIYDEKQQRLFDPYKVFEFDGFKVGVIGLITHETAFIGNKEFIKGLSFTMPEAETAGLIGEVNAKADVTIALTHMGHSHIDIGTDVSLAKAVNGLDMIIGGHSAEAVCVNEFGALITAYQPGDECIPDRVNGTWVMQAQEWGKYVGRADFTFEDGELSLDSYKLIPINLLDQNGHRVGGTIPENAEILALLRPFHQAGGAALSKVIGSTTAKFERFGYEHLPNAWPLGKLIAESMRSATGADIGLMNSGGIRDSLPAGEITMRNILTVQPFSNTVVLNTFTGEELIAYFDHIQLTQNGNQKEVQMAGLYFDKDGHLKLTETNTSIDPIVTYTVAMNNFMAFGGDSYLAINHLETFVDTGMLDYQVLSEYISVNSPLTP